MSVTALLLLFMIGEWALNLALGALIVHALHLAPGWALAIAVLFWIAARVLTIGNAFRLALKWGDPIPPALHITRLQLLACIARECLAVARSFSFLQPLAPLWARWVYAEPRRGARPVVLLVHGAMCNASVSYSMRRALDQAGFDTEVVNLPSPRQPIAIGVPVLADRIEAICKLRGIERLPVVAHSMGGLVVRAYIAAQSDALLEQVITIATPHAGTLFANLGQWRAIHEMRPGSNFLKALAAKEGPKRHVDMTCLYSHHDNIVAPPSNATLPGAKSIAYSGIGHVSLIRDKRVQRQVIVELRRPRVTTWVVS
jgi:triacylglycerol esterase/lipase EstA (alpha/beta hydrolase family)